ncbi:hypothetical protein HMPREF1114_1964 [Streptococcus oralis SK100]|nr:hypothetical protein HMPREF1114_1964 [Streptococcus oralis SK100]
MSPQMGFFLTFNVVGFSINPSFKNDHFPIFLLALHLNHAIMRV